MNVERGFRELAKHVRVYLLLVRLNVMSQLEYRVNLLTGILMELGFLVAKMLYALVVYRVGRTIGGFTPDEFLVFVGTFVIATGFYAGLYMMNFFQLSALVGDGSFDALMTKPISLQFIATLRRSDLGIFLVDLVGGIAIVVVGLGRAGGAVSAGRIAGYALLLAGGVVVGYAVYLVPQSLVFRIVNARAITGATASFWDFNNVPSVVYDRVGQAVGSFIVPVFLITSFPSLFVLGRMASWQLAWAGLAPFLFIAFARWTWSRGLRHYTSASS